MNGLIKKVFIVACISSFVAHTSQALTWSQAGETAAQGVSLVARTAFWAIKSGGKLINCCLPQDISAKAAVGGVTVGAVAAYARCPKVAVVSTAIGACAAYLNYLYRDRRGHSVEFSEEITPGGPAKRVVTPESEIDCFKRSWKDRHNSNSTGVIIGK